MVVEVRQEEWDPVTGEMVVLFFSVFAERLALHNAMRFSTSFLFLSSFARAMAGPHYIYGNVYYVAPCAIREASETADPSLLLCEADTYTLSSTFSWTTRPLQGAGLCQEFTASPYLFFLNTERLLIKTLVLLGKIFRSQCL